MSEFVTDPYTTFAKFDTEAFLLAVAYGIGYLDHIVDVNLDRHPLKEQRANSYNFRNVGLGCFGYGTALMKMGIKYGSKEAIEFTDKVFNEMFRTAVRASSELAKEYGTFPRYKDNAEKIWESEIILKHFSQEEIKNLKKNGLRNCTVLSIAPTGSLATFLNESGGVEPEYAISYTRRTVGLTNNEDHYYQVYCKAAKEYMNLHKTNVLPDYFVGSADIDPMNRVKVQAVMQNHIDTAISSTVNLPESASEELMEKIYLEAWKQGLKGITIFRNNCKKVGILTTSPQHDTNNVTKDKEELPRGYIMSCSDNLIGLKRKIIGGCGGIHVEAFFDEDSGALQEVYLSKGSAGGCAGFMVGLSRMISLACRAGVSIDAIKDQLDSTGSCPSYAVRSATKRDTSKGSCCPMAIGNALMDMYKEFNERFVDEDDQETEEIKMKPEIKRIDVNPDKKNICPICGSKIRYEGGCIICPDCGWSKCD